MELGIWNERRAECRLKGEKYWKVSESVAASVLIALLLTACPQQSWESAMAAGQEALTRKDYARAERMFSAALVKVRGGDDDDLRIALTLTFLARAYEGQRKFVDAEPQYLEALRLVQKVRGPDHLDVAAILNNLGVLNRMHGQYPEAEHYLKRALAIKEGAHGPSHPDVALTVTNLAQLHAAKGEHKTAAPLYERALGIYEEVYGPNDLRVAEALDRYVAFLRTARRDDEADRLERRAEAIRAARATQG